MLIEENSMKNLTCLGENLQINEKYTNFADNASSGLFVYL
jgi:hypothetical protein